MRFNFPFARFIWSEQILYIQRAALKSCIETLNATNIQTSVSFMFKYNANAKIHHTG